MRPILALLTTVAVLGSVTLYRAFIRSLPPIDSSAVELEHAAGKFTVDLTLTFDAVNDSSFSLDPVSIEVVFRDKKIVVEETVKAGVPVVLDLEGVRVGFNDFNVVVNVPDLEMGSPGGTGSEFGLGLGNDSEAEDVVIPERAVRVRVLRDGVPIPGAEQTIWSRPGERVSGKVTIDVPQSRRADPEHEH